MAENIKLLDVREVCTFASYFVICSGDSDRQLQAIADEIEKVLKKNDSRLVHTEGTSSSGWILCDYGFLVVHIFTPEQREYFNFDELWSKAKVVLQVQ